MIPRSMIFLKLDLKRPLSLARKGDELSSPFPFNAGSGAARPVAHHFCNDFGDLSSSLWARADSQAQLELYTAANTDSVHHIGG